MVSKSHNLCILASNPAAPHMLVPIPLVPSDVHHAAVSSQAPANFSAEVYLASFDLRDMHLALAGTVSAWVIIVIVLVTTFVSIVILICNTILLQMGEFTLLPDGRVFLCNGAQVGEILDPVCTLHAFKFGTQHICMFGKQGSIPWVTAEQCSCVTDHVLVMLVCVTCRDHGIS